uniref:C-type lectin domain-containing protein n=1 Tax=Biomphalaria glabrata TaxID=6526 RepID=A0A2C9KGG4_BIOGL
MELTKVSVVLSMLAWTLLTTTSGQCISSTPFPCTFKLLYNKTFVDNIVQYLDQDSYTVILEYILNLTNVGPDFDLVKRTSPDAFQPWRWFRTQGKASYLWVPDHDLCVLTSHITETVFWADHKIHSQFTDADCHHGLQEAIVVVIDEKNEDYYIQIMQDSRGGSRQALNSEPLG